MIPYAEALARILARADRRGPLPGETIPSSACAGRVSAREVLAAEPLPAFDNSAMDGFAVRSADTAHGSALLPIVGSLAAGDAVGPLPAGAVEIMTGAPVPLGFDSIVRIEDVQVETGGRAIALTAPARAGDYVRRAGSDFAAGQRIVAAGEALDARHVMAFAALGVEKVEVRRRPRLALISTGREFAEGTSPAPGKIRNSTSAYLEAAAAELGAELRYCGNVPDDEPSFLRLAERAVSDGCDALITTGAVSMGRFDFVTKAVAKLGAETVFHKTAIRPGKPALFAAIPNGPAIFGLPGNPLSTVVGLRFLVAPYLRRRLGLPDERWTRARLSVDVEKPEGLACFFKARVRLSAEGASVEVFEGQASFRVEPLLRANAWALLPEAGTRLGAGSEADVAPLWPENGGWL